MESLKTRAQYKMCATCLGIKTNITGTMKVHVYIVLIPFQPTGKIVPYSYFHNKGFALKDISFDVDESFYRWLYSEMCKNGGRPVILKLDEWAWKTVFPAGDTLIRYSEENTVEMSDDFDTWFQQGKYKEVHTIILTNPYLYLVPFPVKPILLTMDANQGTFFSYKLS
jgi:hypothetical protein